MKNEKCVEVIFIKCNSTTHAKALFRKKWWLTAVNQSAG